MALFTMAGWAIRNNNPRAQAIVFSLIMRGNIMARDVPLETRRTLSLAGLRWDSDLPAPTWATLNSTPTEVTGDPRRHEEQAYFIRNKIVTDLDMIGTEGQVSNPHSDRIAAYIRSTSYTFNDAFFNNSPLIEPKAIIGLKWRIDNPETSKVSTSCKINFNATMTGAATAAQFTAFKEKLNNLLSAVESPEGDNVVIYMNSDMKNRLEALAGLYAGQGGFRQDVDQLGRSIQKYKNATIREVGTKSDQTTQIITSVEAADGTTETPSTYTSIYAVNYGVEDGLNGWQFDDRFGENTFEEDGVSKVTVLKWAGGLFARSNKCIARGYGIKLS